MKTTLAKYILAGLLAIVCYEYGKSVGKSKVEIKEVVKVQERVRTRTEIIERPDGTKITVIKEDKQTKLDKRLEVKPSLNIWSVGISYAPPLGQREVYSVDIYRRLFGAISVGIYGRTDREFGIGVRYEY